MVTGFVALPSLPPSLPRSSSSVVDVLALQDAEQSLVAVETLAAGLASLSDLYVLATFRLPPKLGGVLFGLYSKQDNRKYLEMAVMGKINKGGDSVLPLWYHQNFRTEHSPRSASTWKLSSFVVLARVRFSTTASMLLLFQAVLIHQNLH